MSLDYNKYNSVAREALTPFDASLVRERKQNPNNPNSPIFKYVPPEQYRAKALAIFPDGYQFGPVVGTVQFMKTAVSAIYRFIGTKDGITYDVSTLAIEPFTFASGTETIIQADQTASKLQSNGLKLCLREMGFGHELYADKKPQGASSAAPTYNAAPVDLNADHYDPNWTGDAPIAYSKHKNTPYNQLEDGMITFCCNLTDRQTNAPKPDVNALKERARRQRAAASNAANDASDDEDIPF